MNNLLPVTRMLNAALNGEMDPWIETDGETRWTPRADILEGEKDYMIVMDMPGVSPADLELNLDKQTLWVSTKTESEAPAGFKTLRRERPARASFSRSFRLGTTIAQDQVMAKLDKGVLRITLPKSEQSLPRRIDVVQED